MRLKKLSLHTEVLTTYIFSLWRHQALKYLDEALSIGLEIAPRGDIVNQVERRRAESFIMLGRELDARHSLERAWEVLRWLGDRYEVAVLKRVEVQDSTQNNF